MRPDNPSRFDNLGRGLSVSSMASSASTASHASSGSSADGAFAAQPAQPGMPPSDAPSTMQQQVSFSAEERSRERGRPLGRSQGSEQKNRLRSRSRQRASSQGPLFQILSNFKPFVRDSSSREQRKDTPATTAAQVENSPRWRSISSGSSVGGSGDEPERRGSARSRSPSLRRVQDIPSLLLSSGATAAAVALPTKSGDSRRNSGYASPDSRRGSTGSTDRSSNKSRMSSDDLLGVPSPTESHRKRSSSWSRDEALRQEISSELQRSDSTASGKTEALRHRDLPPSTSAVRREKLSFIRVYRQDGTFGTIACPPDIKAKQLLQLAARKFFIGEAEECHLVALAPESVTVLQPYMQPSLVIQDLLIRAGYHSALDRLNDVCRDDTSFVCRIVLANINVPIRPPRLAQSRSKLVLHNSDVTDAPSLVSADPTVMTSLDVSWSAFSGTTVAFPHLEEFIAQGLFLLNGGVIPASMLTQLSQFGANLTHLDLSRNGLSNINDVDFAVMPHLTHLDLRGNNLIRLPSTLQHLPFLRRLDCGTNKLTNFEIWNPSLECIDLSYNRLERIVVTHEQAFQMVNLRTLQLCANYLDTLPETVHLFPALVDLDIRYNLIVNPLNAMVPTLRRLVASYNPQMLDHQTATPSTSFSTPSTPYGDIPLQRMSHVRELQLIGLNTLRLHETFSMARVTSLDMRSTHMPFVHEMLFHNAPNLQVLNLSNNNLAGLPAAIGQLRLLEELHLSDNGLVDLPQELFDLPGLKTLDVHSNNLKALNGRIWSMPKLRILNISSNLLGSLPTHTAAGLSGSVTAPIVCLIACDNQLTEEVFDVLAFLPTLTRLNLAYNHIAEVPNSLFIHLPVLEELSLSGNRLSTMPHDNLDSASNLRVLYLNSNKLHTLPAELSKATRLELLDVASNFLRYNVANWPFDWNWRWNQNLVTLNFSQNKRLEIRRSVLPADQAILDEDRIANVAYTDSSSVDLSDFCVLPQLANLGLMDVTLTTNSVPYQSEFCRVRTYGSDLATSRIGIADTLGFRPLAINDFVAEHFRGNPDEMIVGMFDGYNELPGAANKISHLVQQLLPTILKAELQSPDANVVDALRRAFLAVHREIGNTALLSPEEIAHTSLGHRSATATRLNASDWHAGSGATILYFRGAKLYIATVGGAKVVMSFGNGAHKVLSKPLPPIGAELERIRASGGVVDPRHSYLYGDVPYPRMIGCHAAGTVLSAAPSIYEYDLGRRPDPADQLIVASPAIWEKMSHETAADIVRSVSDPMLAALKLRDFALAYGMTDRSMVMVVGRPQAEVERLQSTVEQLQHEDESSHARRRRQSIPDDSALARLGSEVLPPSNDVAMVFTDIRNSTYLWENHPVVMRAAIKTHNTLMRRSMRLMEGYEVKSEGDAFVVSFHTPIKALIWCLTVQQSLLVAEWPRELLDIEECAPIYDEKGTLLFRGLSVRMGIHCGRPLAEPDPVTHRMDYFGPMVNRASRISGIALGGQVTVSSDLLGVVTRDIEAHKAVVNGESPTEAYPWISPAAAESLERSIQVLAQIEYVVEELGELKLRGIENPEHVYTVYPRELVGRRRWYEQQHADSYAQSQVQMQVQAALDPPRNTYLLNSPQDTPDSAFGLPASMSGLTISTPTSPTSVGPLPDPAATTNVANAIAVNMGSPTLSSRGSSSLESPNERLSLPLSASTANSEDRKINKQSVDDIGPFERSSRAGIVTMPAPQGAGGRSSYPSHTLHSLHMAPPIPRVVFNAPYQSPITSSIARGSWDQDTLSTDSRHTASVVSQDGSIRLMNGPQVVPDPLQVTAHRLEAICAALAGDDGRSHLTRLKLLEPPVASGSEAACAATSVWMTRINNAIARIDLSE